MNARIAKQGVEQAEGGEVVLKLLAEEFASLRFKSLDVFQTDCMQKLEDACGVAILKDNWDDVLVLLAE